MARQWSMVVFCDVEGCGAYHGQFESEHEANGFLGNRGWYYDAQTDRCAEHWPGWEDGEAQERAAEQADSEQQDDV